MELVRQIAREFCQYYLQAGHQVVFAVHWEPDKKLHIHFAVNTINFCTGKKWHTSNVDLQMREELLESNRIKYEF